MYARQFAWLKALRLHKYAPQLLGETLQRLPHLTIESLGQLGLTQGASKKLLSKVESADGNELPWSVPSGQDNPPPAKNIELTTETLVSEQMATSTV